MSAIAYHDAITKVLDDIRRTQIGEDPAGRRSDRDLDRRVRPRLALRERPLRHPRDGRLPPLRQLRGLRPPLRPAPHVVERRGPGRGARAALDRAKGGLRARLPPELRAPARRLLRRLLARRPERGADRGRALREGAGADRDHRVLARQRGGGEGHPLVGQEAVRRRRHRDRQLRGARGLAGGRRAAGEGRRGLDDGRRLRGHGARRGDGRARLVAKGHPPTTFVSPNVPGIAPATTASSRPTRGGSRSGARREHAVAATAGRAPGRGPSPGCSCSASRPRSSARPSLSSPSGSDRPRPGRHAVPRHERLHAGLELRPRRAAGPLRHEAAARGRAPGGGRGPPGRGRRGELRQLLLAVALLGLGGSALNGASNALVADLHEDPAAKSAALNRVGLFFGFGALFIPFAIGLLLRAAGLAGSSWRRGPVRRRRGWRTPARLPAGQAGGRPVARGGRPVRPGPAGAAARAPALLPVRQRVHRRRLHDDVPDAARSA